MCLTQSRTAMPALFCPVHSVTRYRYVLNIIKQVHEACYTVIFHQSLPELYEVVRRGLDPLVFHLGVGRGLDPLVFHLGVGRVLDPRQGYKVVRFHILGAHTGVVDLIIVRQRVLGRQGIDRGYLKCFAFTLQLMYSKISVSRHV